MPKSQNDSQPAPKMLEAINGIPTKGLIIGGAHLDRILNGTGSWEMRSVQPNKNESIALISAGSDLIVAVANLVGIKKQVNYQTKPQGVDYYRVSNEHLQTKDFDYWDISWTLENTQRLMVPIRHQLLNDANGWISLELSAQEQLALVIA